MYEIYECPNGKLDGSEILVTDADYIIPAYEIALKANEAGQMIAVLKDDEVVKTFRNGKEAQDD